MRAIRDAVVRWPLVSVRAFCDQAANDHEIAAATAILNEAKSAGVLLVDARDPKRAQAVRALVTVGEHTVYDAVQEFTDAVFVLGVVYGLRLGSLGGVR